MDLLEMIPYAKVNSGYKYILVCIDVFSRFGRALPLKDKSGDSVVKAMAIMLKNEKPRHLQTDEGLEFYNAKVKSLLKKHNINHYSVFSQHKAAVVERFNRTLRERLTKYTTHIGSKKWLSVLPKILVSYNNSEHLGINKLKPIDVYGNNESKLWYLQNQSEKAVKAKSKVGDYVRISKISGSPFIKNFNQNWSDEIFQIIKVNKQNPVMYTVKDYEDEPVKGKFYQQEIQVVELPNVYRIQEILKTKGEGKHKQYYVKWHGYSKPSWIKQENLIST